MGRFVEVVRGLYYEEELLRSLTRFIEWSELVELFSAVKRPCRKYFVRVNTALISVGELVDLLRSRGFEVYRHEFIEEAIWFPVEGPFELPVADKVVVADKYAAESVYQGADLYAPGVVKANGVKRGDEVLVVAPTGEPVGFGVAVMDGEEMIKRRRGLAVKVLISVYRAPKVKELPEYRIGLIYDQSLPAQVVTRVLDPQPGEVIVDMCAAPGGKTTHIAQLLRGKGVVYAFDDSSTRIKRLEYEVKRMKLKNVIIIKHDSRYIHVDYPTLKAHKVLIDPPCSALGVRPKLYDVKSYREVIGCSEYQKQFLREAVKILVKGGVIVYSTCTITPEENEEIVKYAIEKLGLELEDTEYRRLGSPALPLLSREEGIIRFYPHRHDTPGYFIAKFRKRN